MIVEPITVQSSSCENNASESKVTPSDVLNVISEKSVVSTESISMTEASAVQADDRNDCEANQSPSKLESSPPMNLNGTAGIHESNLAEAIEMSSL